MPDRKPEPPPPAAPVIHEVRYSLPDMLGEIEQERRESSFAMETLDQIEIRKIFANRHTHRARAKK